MFSNFILDKKTFCKNITGRAMGGHGGLNILPQKSWNVYGWKQRQKTARDEEIAAEEEQAVLNAEVQVQR